MPGPGEESPFPHGVFPDQPDLGTLPELDRFMAESGIGRVVVFAPFRGPHMQGNAEAVHRYRSELDAIRSVGLSPAEEADIFGGTLDALTGR